MIKKHAVCLAGLLVLLAGCDTGHHIGGREFPLTITTTQNGQPLAGATAYVVPNDEWLAYGKDLEDPGCRKFLADYKVTDGKTPVTIYGVSYQMVIVVESGGHLTKTRTPAVHGARPIVNIEVAQ